MGNKTVWAKYWPAALFAVSNVAALTLVIKANSAYDSPADTSYQAAAEPWLAPTADDPFDPVNSSATVDGKQPLLWDFGSDFDLDKPADSGGSVGFLDAARNRLRDLKDKATDAVRRDKRKERERQLLQRPWNVNYYSPDGNYLGRHSISPPWGGDLPPLSPFENYSFQSKGHEVTVATDGNQTIMVRVDPTLFADNQSMAEFLTDLTDQMIIAGIQPQVQVGRADSTLGVDAGRVGGKVPTAVMLPPNSKPIKLATGRIPTNQSLPKPPADVMSGTAPPAFDSHLGDRLPPPPDDIRNMPGPGPLPSMPGGTATATRPTGATTVRKTEQPLGPTPEPQPEPQPEAKPAPEPEPKAAQPAAEVKPAAPEPKVRLQIQLSQIADKRRAEEAVSRLRSAGFGGSSRQTSSGLGYWVVHSRVFTSRKEANAALAKIRSMGYDAWFS